MESFEFNRFDGEKNPFAVQSGIKAFKLCTQLFDKIFKSKPELIKTL